MAHKVVGNLKHDGKTFGHGDSISADKVGGDENFEHLQTIGSIVSNAKFKELYPEQDGEVIQPPGTPSNLGEVEGTDLAAEQPKDQASKSSDESANPAPPKQSTPAADKGSDATKAAAAPAAKKTTSSSSSNNS